ncbi:hypothetical protein Agub_g7195, partial [Astrephomene gubernaculifera]
PEVLLASDVVYTAPARKALFATLAALLAPLPVSSRGPAQQEEAAQQSQAGGLQEGQRQEQAAPSSGPGGVCGPPAGQDGDLAEGQSGLRGGGGGGSHDSSGEGGSSLGGNPSSGSSRSGGCGGFPVAVLSFEMRPGVEELPQLCEQHGLASEEVPPEELHPEWRTPDIRVFLLRRRRQPAAAG